MDNHSIKQLCISRKTPPAFDIVRIGVCAPGCKNRSHHTDLHIISIRRLPHASKYVHILRCAIASPRRYYHTLKIRLLNCTIQLENAIHQRSRFSKVKLNKELDGMCKQSIKALKTEYQAASDYMLKLIKSDARLSHLYDIVISVPNIGL